jgi:hypothetical protein
MHVLYWEDRNKINLLHQNSNFLVKYETIITKLG